MLYATMRDAVALEIRLANGFVRSKLKGCDTQRSPDLLDYNEWLDWSYEVADRIMALKAEAPSETAAAEDDADAIANDPLATLRYIADAKSGWTFKVDPLEHAESVVDEMREMAAAAVARAESNVARSTNPNREVMR